MGSDGGRCFVLLEGKWAGGGALDKAPYLCCASDKLKLFTLIDVELKVTVSVGDSARCTMHAGKYGAKHCNCCSGSIS